MSKYSSEDRFQLFGFFPHYYTMVTQHSRFADIDFGELEALSPKSRLLGEFLAASGMEKIDFQVLKDVIAFVDDYLETGILQAEQMKDLHLVLAKQSGKLEEIAQDYYDGGQSDEHGYGAPVVLFVFNYAHNLLSACDAIEDGFEGENKQKFLKLCRERKRTDPDPDKTFEPV